MESLFGCIINVVAFHFYIGCRDVSMRFIDKNFDGNNDVLMPKSVNIVLFTKIKH